MSYEVIRSYCLIFDSFIQTLNYCKDLFHQIASDKELPIDQRWEFFCKFGEHFGKKHIYMMHFSNVDGCYYDIGFERHQMIELPTLYEHLKNPPETLKEEMLQSGYYSFEYDW